MIDEMDDDNRQWVEPALKYMVKKIHVPKYGMKEPPSLEDIQSLIGWEINP
jgi:hypothetical protein